ncbi:hypothetical protein Tco_0330416, partial [Tanacetum coccineum]
VFSTWMAFGGNTRDLGSFREETGQDYDSTPNLLKKQSFRRWRRRRQLLRQCQNLIKTTSGVSRRRQNVAASNETLEASSKRRC